MLQHDITPRAIETRDASYVLGTYARTALHPREGRGARLFDADGNSYWDLMSGIAVNALGYDHPAIRQAMLEGVDDFLHLSNLYYHPLQGLLAERLVRLSGLSRAFFCNSGTEAMEAALKFARLARPGRLRVVALRDGFHGRSLGALSITGTESYRAPFAPFGIDAVFAAPDDTDAITSLVDQSTLAIVLEPVMGEAGVIPLSPEFLRAAARTAANAGALLICDEVQCGLGRTGSWFAFQPSGIEPDIVTLAKPLGGGLPLGAVLVSDEVAARVAPGLHGSTFGGNPLACRLGLAVLDTIESEGLVARAAEVGERFGASLQDLARCSSAITAVRGAGLMWGIELASDAAPVARALLERGFITGVCRGSTLRLLPPLVVPTEALDAFINTLSDVLAGASESTAERKSA